MELLERALNKIPELSVEKSTFIVPESETFVQGNKTILKNILNLSDKARRKSEDISKYLTKELGVPINNDGQQLIISGKFSNDEINRCIKRYFDVYVICRECHKPDTQTDTEGRGMLYVVCKACGARYGVKS